MNKYQHDWLHTSLSVFICLHLMADFPSQPTSNTFDLTHGFPPPLGCYSEGETEGILKECATKEEVIYSEVARKMLVGLLSDHVYHQKQR